MKKTMKTKQQTIGERIRELRESKNFTQQDLSQQLHVSDKTISKWEKDGSVPDTDILITISNLFNVTLDYLLTGNTPVVEKEAISKIELAAREDNIALLSDVNLKELDDKGKNIEYYAKKYKAEKIADYLMSNKFEEICKEPSMCKFHHITALPEGTNDEDNRILLAFNGPYITAPKKCAEYEKDGYHSFKVFRQLGLNEKNGQDYKDFAFFYLVNGQKRMEFDLSTLDDNESGILELTIFREKTYKLNKKDEKGNYVPDYYPQPYKLLTCHAYVRPSVRNEFIQTLESLDFKNWKSQSWGCSIYYIFANLDKYENTQDTEKNYINPGKDNYLKFTKAIRRLCFESLKTAHYKEFLNIFDGNYVPYQREKVPLFASLELFRDIELEMKEMEDGTYHRGDILLKGRD